MSEIHELAVIEVKQKQRTAEQAKLLAFKWDRLIAYAKELCPTVITQEILQQAETAKLAYEFALMEVEQAQRVVNGALRKVLREREAYGLKIEDLSSADVGRRVVVLLGPKTEEVAELAGWTKSRLIVRRNIWGRSKIREVKPSRCKSVIDNRGCYCGNCGEWRILKDGYYIEQCPECGEEAFNIHEASECGP